MCCFLVCLVWVGVLYLGYCLMYGFVECWVSIACFTDLCGGHVQVGMLAVGKNWDKYTVGRDELSSSHEDIVRRELL